jgi:hypothetical protein
MPKVFRMGYMELDVTDMDAMLDFYVGTVGLKSTEVSQDAAYLSFGYDHHNLALRKKKDAGLACIGYQLTKDTEVPQMERILSDAGVRYTRKSDARPGISTLLELEPVGGHIVELYHEISAPAPHFGTSGIVPLRLGHMAMISPEGDKLVALHTDVLGFWKTDYFGEALTFLTCNHEHHVLNIVNAPIAPRLHHLAFQLRDYAHHSIAADILARSGQEVLWGPARHTAGHNVAQYSRDPQGFLL